MKIGSLCSGYGGLDLAVEALMGAETIWHSEFDKHANKVYETHWDNPNLGDLTLIDWNNVPKIDILTGGYPCQPFSMAGKRQGTNDKRHIFPYIANAIRTLQPRWVFLENVRGHLTLGFDTVLQTLTEIGYDAKWTLARASDVGGCHRRERLFIIAEPIHTNNTRSPNLGSQEGQRQSLLEPCSLGSSSTDTCCERLQGNQWIQGQPCSCSATNTIHNQQPRDRTMSQLGGGHNTRSNVPVVQQWGRYETAIQRWEQITRPAPEPLLEGKLSAIFVEWMMGLPQGWVTNVELSRTQQLKILGNGVVPQQAYYAYSKLLEIE